MSRTDKVDIFLVIRGTGLPASFYRKSAILSLKIYMNIIGRSSSVFLQF